MHKCNLSPHFGMDGSPAYVQYRSLWETSQIAKCSHILNAKSARWQNFCVRARVYIFVPLYIGRSLIIFPARNSASKSNTRITNGALRNSQLISINHILRLYSQHTHTILTHCFEVQNAHRGKCGPFTASRSSVDLRRFIGLINFGVFLTMKQMLLPWVRKYIFACMTL